MQPSTTLGCSLLLWRISDFGSWKQIGIVLVPVLVPIINRIGNSRFGTWPPPPKKNFKKNKKKPQFWFQFWKRVQLNFYYSGLELVINCWLIKRSSPCYWLINPPDCTSSVWDELMFIPGIEAPAVRRVESKRFSAHPPTVFFFTSYCPCSPQLPCLPTYPAWVAMATTISLLLS